MKHYKTETVPASTREVETHSTCDICGERREPRSCYDIADVTVSCETGTRYPGSNNTDTLSCDLCADCFTEKLVPWLETQGVVMRKKEDWW